MTPEDKAEELYTMFDDLTARCLTVDAKTTKEELDNHAKMCAIMCATEVANQKFKFEYSKVWWNDVIKELQNYKP